MTTKQLDSGFKLGMPKFMFGWLVELVALFILATVAGPYVYAWIDANDIPIRVSVLWIPVVFLALNYGLLSGFIASVTAFVIYTLQSGLVIGVYETIDVYAMRVGLEPLLWTVAACFFGGARALSQERELKLGRELAEERQLVSTHQERYARLRDRVEFLERSLTVGRDPQLRHTIQKVGALASMGASECRDSLYDILTSAANGAKITLFVCTGAQCVKLSRADSSGNAYSDVPPAAIYPATDGEGNTVLEVHVEQIDPDHFTEVDQVYFYELCGRIGSILGQRGGQDLYRLAVRGMAA